MVPILDFCMRTDNKSTMAVLMRRLVGKTISFETCAYIVTTAGMISTPIAGFWVLTMGSLSMFITLASYILVVALINLAFHINRRRSVQGISMKMIQMQILSSAVRLCCTTRYLGYVPIDRSGDGFYQFLDFVVVCVGLLILYFAYWKFSSTYDREVDTFCLPAAVCFCFLSASFTHSSLNSRPFFDMLWNAALNLDTFSGLAQSWLLGKSSRTLPSYAGTYIVAMFLSRLTSSVFWYNGYVELNRTPFAYSGEAVMLAHVIALLLVTDYIWHFASDYFQIRILGRGSQGVHFDFTADALV